MFLRLVDVSFLYVAISFIFLLTWSGASSLCVSLGDELSINTPVPNATLLIPATSFLAPIDKEFSPQTLASDPISEELLPCTKDPVPNAKELYPFFSPVESSLLPTPVPTPIAIPFLPNAFDEVPIASEFFELA